LRHGASKEIGPVFQSATTMMITALFLLNFYNLLNNFSLFLWFLETFGASGAF